MNGPLPADLQRRWGDLHDIKQRGPNEWSSACPQCGGAHGARRDPSDRFRMFAGDSTAGARGWCRQCAYFAFADDDQQRPDPGQIRIATTERLKLAEQENRRIKAKLQRIADADFWKRWHDDMIPIQRGMWYEQGINDWAIETYRLGYCADYAFYYGGEERHSPTMTIPHYGPEWELVNIQHRLLNPPEPGDKYRQMAGVPAAMFLTEPEKPLAGAVLIVEGAKKAIVTYLNIGHELTIVGVPSKTPSVDMLEKLDGCDPVYLALDPDAYIPIINQHGQRIAPAVNRIAAKLDGRAMVVKLPVKPDDFFFIHGGKADDMKAFIRQAKKVAG